MTDRQGAERWGRFAEGLAVWSLRLRGYRVLDRRFRTPAGEIDIVARRGAITAFIEVKARRDLAAAAEAVSNRQKRRLIDAAAHWLARDAMTRDVRFDAILVVPWRVPRHIPDAFRADS